MRVDLELLGEKQVSRTLLRYGNRGADMSTPLRRVADKITEWNEDQFRTQGARGSGGWDALAESTVEAKGHDVILIDSGDLYNDVTSISNWIITDSFAHLQLPDETHRIGMFHQLGTVNMPQRRVIDLTEMDKRDIMRTLMMYLRSGVII